MTNEPSSASRRPLATVVLGLLLMVGALSGAYAYAGFYNIGADAPHSRPVYQLLQLFRNRSIIHHATGIAVPADLNDEKRIAAGAALYGEMCTGCHLAPGINPTELSKGLYPAAPELARGDDLSAAQQFWVIKHGIKLSAMPAWGRTHNDQLIWDMVSFVRHMPRMNGQQFEAAVASAP